MILMFSDRQFRHGERYEAEMHTPTEAFRRSGKIVVATLVLEDYVRGMSEYDFGRFLETFLTYEEEQLARQAVMRVPIKHRFKGIEYRGRENRSDSYICRDIALHAENKETLRVLARSYYWRFTFDEVRDYDSSLATEIETIRAATNPFSLEWQGREGRALRFGR